MENQLILYAILSHLFNVLELVAYKPNSLILNREKCVQVIAFIEHGRSQAATVQRFLEQCRQTNSNAKIPAKIRQAPLRFIYFILFKIISLRSPQLFQGVHAIGSYCLIKVWLPIFEMDLKISGRIFFSQTSSNFVSCHLTAGKVYEGGQEKHLFELSYPGLPFAMIQIDVGCNINEFLIIEGGFKWLQ